MQERVTTGKRINRASDDPAGAEMVLNLRTSQAEITQFQRNAQTAVQKLTAGDDGFAGYEDMLERVRTLVTQGLSDTSSPATREALAIEVEALRSRMLAVANTQNGGNYVFGGTRQNAPPFDPVTGAPAATPTAPEYIQIEPGSNAIAVGVTADKVFGDATSTVFADLTNAAAALRGTGNAAADKAMLLHTIARVGVFSDLMNTSRAIIGAGISTAETAKETLTNNFLSIDESASEVEGADFAASAVALSDAQRALDATLQVAATGRRSLFDFLG